MATVIQNYCDLKVFLKPYFRVMAILGIHYSPDESTPVETFAVGTSKRTKMLRWKKIAYKAYQLIVLLLIWLHVLRYTVCLFIAKPIISKSSVYRLCVFCYCLHASITTTVILWMFSKEDGFYRFIDQWNGVSKKAASLGCKQEVIGKQVRRTTRVLLLAMVIVNCTGGVGFLINTKDGNELIKATLAPFGYSLVGLTYGLYILQAILWACSLSFFAVVTKCLTLQFKLVSQEITGLVNTASSFPGKILQFTRLHLEMCDLVDLLNQYYKYILASTFLLNIIVLLCVGYSVIKSALMNLSLILMMATISVHGIYNLVSLSLLSANLHEQVHKPLPSLYKLRGQNANLEDVLEVNLFIAKLQESSVGITAMDILLVKNGTLLTLFGVFLTYLFVVIQFSL
ncbi:hypothetical protein SNE40_013555 [Patella caerulea]|uniref:Gustatory receptor n=1 Tax=Patella caerulea TaxID=87958 RepID=A0AAN8JJK8_PATCE